MRRAVIVALVWLIAAAPCAAQWATTPVATTAETTDDFTATATMVATIPATVIGYTITIAVFSNQNRSVSSLTCGNTGFTSIHRQGTSLFVEIVAFIATSSVTSCTVVLTGNSDGLTEDAIVVQQWTGGAAVLAESGTSTGTTNGSTVTNHSAAAVTPDTTSTLFIGAISIDGSTGGYTPDPDFTVSFTETSGAVKWLGYKVQNGSLTAQDFTSTTVTARRSYISLGAMQGSAGGGGGASTRRRHMRGCCE